MAISQLQINTAKMTTEQKPVPQAKHSPPKPPSTLKQKWQTYGLVIGYSLMGILGAAYFSYKTIMIRHENMEKFNRKSRTPTIHKNLKSFWIGGVVGLVVYSYGLWYIVKDLPRSETNQEMRDYSLLASKNRNNPELQNYYIFRTMKMFGVSQQLIKKAEKQFRQMDGALDPNYRQPSLFTQFVKAALERKKVQKQVQKLTGQKL